MDKVGVTLTRVGLIVVLLWIGGLKAFRYEADGIVPFEVSGNRSHESIPGSRLALIEGGTHGLNATHSEQFNAALLAFLNE